MTMAEFNFPELIAQGKEIDKAIVHLKAKLLEPSKLGLGSEAFSALKDIKRELSGIQSVNYQELNKRQEGYESGNNYNKLVSDYLNDVEDFLDKLENAAVETGYIPFKTYCAENGDRQENANDLLNVSGIASLSLYDRTPTNSMVQHRNLRSQSSPATTSSFGNPMVQSTPVTSRHENSSTCPSITEQSQQDNVLKKPTSKQMTRKLVLKR